MNFAISQNWYEKKIELSWCSKQNNLEEQNNIIFIKPHFIKMNVFYPIKLNKNYINQIKKQNRVINENIFDDFNDSEYKYPNIVKQKLKQHYKFNLLYNNIIQNKQEKLKIIQQLLPNYKKELIEFNII